ncbi:MAG TPA: alkyl hydroperoxide reductase [Gemmatimonadaceae bacterium]
MRELESKYAKELVVIGVHSGKYHAERVTSRIRDASLRLDSVHPVLNDRQFRTWRSYAISAWPTLVAIDPAGYVVGAHAGEFTAEALFSFIDGLVENSKSRGLLNTERLHFEADESTIPSGELRYPGKVVIEGRRIAIADSGHGRVLVGELGEDNHSAHIETVIDGLSSPQGMALSRNAIYIADCESHSISVYDLDRKELRTLAGTGSQLRTRADRAAGAMSSPWDVALVGNKLFVAMAGIHQIWSVDVKTGTSRVHAGTGGEDIRDGDNANALLAQPMGIVASGDRLYFADSESNGIRWTDVAEDGNVGTIVGTGLFDFGDVDGTGDEVRLQHAQGVALRAEGGLFVADSYNDCIKIVDPATRSSETWVRGLHEPSGISCSDTHAYVADTDAHRIAVIDLKTKEISGLRLE